MSSENILSKLKYKRFVYKDLVMAANFIPVTQSICIANARACHWLDCLGLNRISRYILIPSTLYKF